MSWLGESDSESAQREHDEAEKDGAKSDFLEQLLHSALSSTYSDAHNAGWDNGVANPKQDD
jgi:hypothetical protein